MENTPPTPTSATPPASARCAAHPVLCAAVVVAAYLAGGWVSLALQIPPDYALMVFFPAGVALVAALAGGRASLAGVWIGSLALQLWLHQRIGADWRHWGILVPPTGATAMAWATARALRRWVGYPSPIDEPGRLLRAFFLVIPAGMTINASLSVPALVVQGVVPADDALQSWLVWWLGDTLGAVLLTPLLLVVVGEPRDAWRSRARSVALPLGVALVMVTVLLKLLNDGHRQELQRRFEQAGQDIALRLQRRLEAQTDALESMGQLVAEVPTIDQARFESNARLWLRRYPGTQNFTFNPVVTAEARQRYECCDPGRPILGRDPEGNVFPAPAAAQHLPITLLVPLGPNLRALGLDVLTLPTLRVAVESAIATDRPTATDPVRLVQEVAQQRGVVLYLPVRVADPANPDTPRLHGIVSSAFRMNDVVDAIVDTQRYPGLGLCLVDPSAPPDNRRLVGAPGCEQRFTAPPPSLVWHGTWSLSFAQKRWVLHLEAEPSFWGAGPDGQRLWITATVGFLAVAMLGSFLMVVSGQRRRTEQLVEQRTLELARSHASLIQLAHFDALTGLVNRSFWTEQAETVLETAQRNGQEVGIIFLDLDRFKHVNDSLGHAQGDRLLQTVAARLQACLRSRDVLGRFGGDEFVALLPWVKGRDGAATVARKIARTLDEPIELDGVQVRVGASLGVTIFPHDGATVDTLLRHADTAMYAAKAAGRNQWRFFEPSMHEHVSRRLAIESALRQAVDDPVRGGLTLVYQPQIDADGRRLLGLEALLRWRHPVLGPISPVEFIGVAEDAGIIDRLGAWVLQTACRQLAAWHAGPDAALFAGVRLAVNVSPIEFARPGFLEHVRQALQGLGAANRLVELEITESLLVQAGTDVTERMRALTELGVGLCLDDFGTGYSSLGYLQRLPIGKLKIDRSFVDGVPGDADSAAIVRATLSMAHDLGLRVVAEGVETPAQRDFLHRHGCDAFQGWLYARAMAPAELLVWIRAHAARSVPA